MPLPLKLGVTFSDAEVADMKAGMQVVINTIHSKIIANLSVKERSDLSKLGPERIPYAEKSIGIYGIDYPQFNPLAYLFADAQKDAETYAQMQQVISKLKECGEVATELQMLAGHFVYLFMRKQYENGQSNVDENVPGAQVIVDGLKGAFEGQGNFSDETTADDTPPTP